MSEGLHAILTRILVDDLEVDADQAAGDVTLAELDLDSLAIAELVVRIKEETGTDLGDDESSMGSLTVSGLADLVATTQGSERTA
ncbi:acyl carrier protein [Streptomyces sp. NPDC017082]|uniref:acyl carrier protein n=1 Tax=Streptomyces sp. NPDC017082 TaxID=3364974 RepID=UPI0037A7B5FC